MPVPNTNTYEDIAGTGITILTTRKDDVFLLSTQDVDYVKRYCWSKHENGYARAVARLPSGKMKTLYLHRLVCATTPEEPHVDHVNGTPWDCRKDNLRTCTRSKNLMNAKKRSDNSTGFKGVGVHSQTGKYRARVKAGGAMVLERCYDTAEEAFEQACKARELAHDKFYRHS